MRKNVTIILLLTILLTGCRGKLNDEFISNFENAYKMVSVSDQLKQLCQETTDYELYINIDNYVMKLTFNVNDLNGTLRYLNKVDNAADEFEYKIKIVEEGIRIDDEKQSIIPHDVLFVYNDVANDIISYKKSMRTNLIQYDVNRVQFDYPILSYYQKVYENLILPFGSKDFAEKFSQKIENSQKDIYMLAYFYDYSNSNYEFSKTDLNNVVNSGGITYNIYEKCI